MKPTKRSLFIGVLAAILLLTALSALLLVGCKNEVPQATVATQATEPVSSDIYWNLDRALYDGMSEAGMSSRTMEDDGYFHIRFFKDGEVVTLRATDRKLINAIDIKSYMGLELDENGIIVGIVDIEDMPVQLIAAMFYVQSAGGNLIKINSSISFTGMEILLETTENTGVWDMTGMSGEIGCEATPIQQDRVIVMGDADGNVTHVFIYDRPGYMRTHEGECQHCGKTVTWSEWTQEKFLPTNGGHYQLMNDIQLASQASIAEDAKICLDLNGKTVTGKENTRIYSLHNPSAELALMDTSEAKSGKLVAVGKSSSQGVCVWVRYGVFNMYAGTLDASQYVSQNNGIAVHVSANTFMYMHGGEIIGGTATYTYNKETKKYSAGLGGTLYVAGKLVINDGIIRDGYAKSKITAYNTDGTPKTYQRGMGGNIFIAGTGIVEMNGGTIQNGRSDGSGGNIYMDGAAELIMNSGTISGGRTMGNNKSGGNIIGYSKVNITIKGGTIENGRSTYRGGNIYTTGTMRISGGNIRGGKVVNYKTGKNLDDQSARNVFMSNNSYSIYGGWIDGGVQIVDTSAATATTRLLLSTYANIDSKTAPNLTISTGGSGVEVQVSKLGDRAKIGITTAAGIFTQPTDEANLDNFYSDIDGAEVLYVDGRLGLGRFSCLCGSNSANAEDHLGDCHGEQLFWGPITTPTKLPNTTGNYYLLGDVNCTAQTSLAADADVKLDLNGYTITGPENFRTISVHNPGAKLTVCDSSEGKTGVIRSHGLGSSQGNVVWTRYGSFDFYGGTLDGSAYTYTDGWSEGKDGIFGTTDDTISSRDGGTLCMGNNSTMRMFAGTVIGNNAAAVTQTKTVDGKEVSFKTTSPGGASLYVPQTGTFEMYGGTIRDGISEDYGGNVLLAGTMIIDGGQILDGICTYNGGNINTKSGSHLELHSGAITGGWGKNVTGNLHCSGTFTMTGGEITGGKVGKTPSATSAHADIQFVNGDMVYTGGKLGNIQLTNSGTNGTEGGCVVNLSGKLDIAAIKLSTYDSKPDDEKVPSMPILEIGGTVQSANAIPVTPSDTTADFAIGKDYALCSADAAPFTLSGSTVTAAADTTTNSLFFGRIDCLCGKETHTKGCMDLWNGAEKRWTPWTSTTTLPTTTAGNYYLTNNVTLPGVQTLQKNVVVTLDLNGFTVTGKANTRMYATHNEGSALTISDNSAAQTGKMLAQGTAFDGIKSCCIWVRYGYFNLLGGTLDGSQAELHNGWENNKVAEKNGGVICAESTPTVNIYGGTIIGADCAATTKDGHSLYAPNGGSLYIAGTLNMYGGTIEGGSTERYGGNLYLGGTANLYGGTIKGGSAVDGGNIYTLAGSTLNVHEGFVIEDGNATKYGGNIRLLGTLNLQGGAIQNGTCTLNGGNIYGNGSSVINMTSGTITGGWGKSQTGNLHCCGTLNMLGGEITGGKSGASGVTTTAYKDVAFVNGTLNYTDGKLGAIQFTNYNTDGTVDGCEINLKGELHIDSIRLSAYDDEADDGNTPIAPVMSISGAVSGSTNIIVSTVGTIAEGKDYTITDSDKAAFTTSLSLSALPCEILRDANTLTIQEYACLCGKATHTKGCLDLWGGEKRVWTAWTSTTTLPNATSGNYYLTKAVKLSSTQTLKANVNVVLDLNGFTVTGPANARMYATQNTGTSMTITDNSAAQTGKLLGNGTDFVGMKSCCIWVRYGTLNLLGGTLDGSGTVLRNSWESSKVSEKNGGVICAEKNTTINIYGGTIKGAQCVATTSGDNAVYAPNGGAVYVPQNTTLNMYGGTIEGGSTENYGGNIYLGGTANLYGGTIKGGSAVDGGNIYALSGSTLNVHEGFVIEDGNATKYGGNLRLYGTLNLQGGSIQNGICTLNGGNIYSNSGSVINMTSGSITGGWGKSQTGNLHCCGTLNMSGGSITGGKTGSSGITTAVGRDIAFVNGTLNYTGGRLDSLRGTNYNSDGREGGCVLNLGGTLDIGAISLGSHDDKDDDGKTPTAPLLNITGAVSGSVSYIATAEGIFAQGSGYTLTDSDANAFTTELNLSGLPGGILREDNTLAVRAYSCLCGKETHTKGCLDLWGGEKRVWTAWTSTTTLPTATGNYYLTANVSLSSKGVQKLAANANVVLDLNGFTVTGKTNDRMYATHNTDSNLTITDNSASQTGKMVGVGDDFAGKSCCIWIRYGTLNILGGTFDGSGTTVHNAWESNKLAEKNGGVICLEKNRTFNMYGGTIIGAKAVKTTVDGNELYAPMGASIYLPSGAVMNMHGGTVKGGNTEKNGGNLYIYGGTLNMHGGTIETGEADDCGGNLFVRGGTVNMDGGVIKNGTRNGVAANLTANFAFTNGGTLNISGGEIHGRLNLGTTIASSDTKTGTVNISGSAKIYSPTAAKPVANNNLSATLTVNIGKLNDDAMIGLQVSSTGKPLTSEKLLASYSDEESLQKALTDGRIGISVYMSGDTYNRTYAFVTRDGKLYVYQTSATPK